MRRLLTYAAVGALLAGAADGAWGQEMQGRRASRLDLGVYAGGSLTSDWFSSRTVRLNGTENPTENGDEEGYAPGYGPAFGALANLWITPRLGLRLHGAYVPMRLPGTEGPFEAAGEREQYVMNTWLYDLGLALRPFATRDVSRWLSSVYFFAGGGGVTVDLAGQDQPLCEGTVFGLGGCLSFEPEQATVAQGTAGAGIDLIPLGRNLALFGELAVHAYDSPVHVDDEWVGPVRAPSGTTVRIADDAGAVTGRLVIGLKAMFGNLIPPPPPVEVPPPPVVVPPPPPVIAPPPPPMNPMREIRVCVVENGMLREAMAMYDTRTGDTTVNGQPIPATTGYAAGATWYIGNEPITVMGRRYVRYGLPRVLGVNEVTRAAEFGGVSVFAEAGAQGAPEVLYVPVRPGCEFQPYQLEVKAGGVRGEE
ncbi:MAG TPA: hypothetical protein VF006_23575 [Longimicrobium sp.]